MQELALNRMPHWLTPSMIRELISAEARNAVRDEVQVQVARPHDVALTSLMELEMARQQVAEASRDMMQPMVDNHRRISVAADATTTVERIRMHDHNASRMQTVALFPRATKNSDHHDPNSHRGQQNAERVLLEERLQTLELEVSEKSKGAEERKEAVAAVAKSDNEVSSLHVALEESNRVKKELEQRVKMLELEVKANERAARREQGNVKVMNKEIWDRERHIKTEMLQLIKTVNEKLQYELETTQFNASRERQLLQSVVEGSKRGAPHEREHGGCDALSASSVLIVPWTDRRLTL